jgi:uncharacterized coiled-coil protein SlyX
MASVFVWKVAAVVFIILTIGASSGAYYYYGQTQIKASEDATLNNQVQQLQTWLNGNTTLAANYRNHVDNLQSKIDTLGTLNASQTEQLKELNTRITDLQTQVSTMQSQIFTLQSEVNNLQMQNSELVIEVNTLTAANSGLLMAVHSLMLEVGNLTLIVNLQVSKVLADGVSFNWSGGDTIQVPEATLSYNYSGYVTISWSSTQKLTFKLAYVTAGNSTSITSNSSSKNDYSVPIIASPLSPTSATASFHNDGCGIFGCPSGSVTYTVTYWY